MSTIGTARNAWWPGMDRTSDRKGEFPPLGTILINNLSGLSAVPIRDFEQLRLEKAPCSLIPLWHFRLTRLMQKSSYWRHLSHFADLNYQRLRRMVTEPGTAIFSFPCKNTHWQVQTSHLITLHEGCAKLRITKK